MVVYNTHNSHCRFITSRNSCLLFRPHRSTTYVDAAYCYRLSSAVRRSVCQSVTTAELIKMPFGTWTWAGPGKHVSDGRVHWRRLANMIEPFVCDGDAAFLSNYSDHLSLFGLGQISQNKMNLTQQLVS